MSHCVDCAQISSVRRHPRSSGGCDAAWRLFCGWVRRVWGCCPAGGGHSGLPPPWGAAQSSAAPFTAAPPEWTLAVPPWKEVVMDDSVPLVGILRLIRAVAAVFCGVGSAVMWKTPLCAAVGSWAAAEGRCIPRIVLLGLLLTPMDAALRHLWWALWSVSWRRHVIVITSVGPLTVPLLGMEDSSMALNPNALTAVESFRSAVVQCINRATPILAPLEWSVGDATSTMGGVGCATLSGQHQTASSAPLPQRRRPAERGQCVRMGAERMVPIPLMVAPLPTVTSPPHWRLPQRRCMWVGSPCGW